MSSKSRHEPLGVETLEDRTVPAVLTVNSLLDGAVDFTDNIVTLREAVQAANDDLTVSPGGQTGSGEDTIEFANGLRGGTITLTEGELRVTESLTIQGLGAGSLTISGGDSSRLFVLGGDGANVYNFNDIALADGNGQGNNERRGGGALHMFADRNDVININRSVLRNHQTNNRVGAAISLIFGSLSITDSAIVNNGGGQGTIYLQDATGNITNSTLSGNQSGFGAVWARSGFGSADLSLTNVTVANNGEGVFYSSELPNAKTTVRYRNSIFSGNEKSFQIGGTTGTISLTSQGNNILSDATGDPAPPSSDRLNTDARITPLTQINGTFVHQLLPGSPAIDRGNDAFAPSQDQRRQARVDGDLDGAITSDIGAFELTNVAPVILAQRLSINENELVVGRVIAEDADLPNDFLTFRIAGNGPDDELFTITPDGVLSFRLAPDFESSRDNVYEVSVIVQDGIGVTSTAIISVSVQPVDDSASVLPATTFTIDASLAIALSFESFQSRQEVPLLEPATSFVPEAAKSSFPFLEEGKVFLFLEGGRGEKDDFEMDWRSWIEDQELGEWFSSVGSVSFLNGSAEETGENNSMKQETSISKPTPSRLSKTNANTEQPSPVRGASRGRIRRAE